jgi:hypothetical protein
MAKWEGDISKSKDIALNVELVGIKNLKMTHTWRLEFDVYEIDSHKVKDLMDKIDKPLVMALVNNDG